MSVFVSDTVSAGFPNTAENYTEQELNLHDYVVAHPASTFFVRVKGNSMVNVGIGSGDILVVDRSLDAKNRDIVVAHLDGEFTLKRLVHKGKHTYLHPENRSFKPIKIDKSQDFAIWGVVTHVLKTFRKVTGLLP